METMGYTPGEIKSWPFSYRFRVFRDKVELEKRRAEERAKQQPARPRRRVR